MLRTTVVLMSVQALLAWLFYLGRQRAKRPWPEWGAAGLLFHTFCLMSVPVILQYVLLWWFKYYSLRRNWSSSKYLVSSLALSVAILSMFGLAGVWRAAISRQRYPVMSLAARLDYETSAAQGTSAPCPHHLRQAPEDGSTLSRPSRQIDVDDLYENSNQAGLGRMRADSLQRLHKSYLDDFVNSPGFGVGRMSHIRYPRLNTYREDPPQQPAPSIPADESLSAGVLERSSRAPSDELLPQLLPLHKAALVDFANPGAYGWIQDREHVAGFEPHSFSELPEQNWELTEPPRWKTQRIELVSLLKLQQPMVYVSDHLPNMEELRSTNTPVRSLDGFERRALSALQYERRDLVGEMTGNKLRMLGSIRAAKKCLECHSVSHGDLLGAFSYELLDQSKPESAPQEAPPETF